MNLFSKLSHLAPEIMKYLFLSLQIILIALLILSFGAFVGVLFCECIETYISELLGLSNKNNSKKNETLKFLGISMGGILVALQAIMSYRRAKTMEDAVEKTEQGQRQDRLKNAIEHLGHKSESVRLGGAYELFHLAQDTPDTPELHQTVHDILCAHIRQTTGEKEYQEKHKSKPSEEVQSLLNLLFIQKPAVFKGLNANLQGSWMIGADLRMACLENAILVGVNLQEADLTGAKLQEAKLNGAQLQEAILKEAQLQEANLTEANLQRAILKKAKLQEAKLNGAQLQEAILEEAQLQEANLTEANLQRAILKKAKLQGATLSDAQLQAAELERAQLQEAILWKANLQMARLSGAQLQAAHLVEAKLRGAVLWGTLLQGANLAKAKLQAAELCFAQLQEANLMEAKLQGITSNKALFDSFEERINDRIGKENELNGATFEGELRQEDLDFIVAEIPDEKAREGLQNELKNHIKSKSYDLPNDHGAFDEPYTDEEAEQWIAEYKEAVVSISI